MLNLFRTVIALVILATAACSGAPVPMEPVETPLPPSPPRATETQQSPASTPAGATQPEIHLLASQVERDPSPATTQTEVNELVSGNTRFAFDLYRHLITPGENIFFSPYSISLALAMTYAGASGNTEAQMAETLHFSLTQESLHPAFNALDQKLRQQQDKSQDEPEYTLNIVNSLWGQDSYPFLADYLDLLAYHYGAGLRLLDFIRDPEGSRLIINEWVSDETEQRIEDLIPPNVIDPDTRLVLVNAIYFNAAWLHQFEPGLTIDGPFYVLDGSEVSVPLMRQTEEFPYQRGNGYQVLELPYKGHQLSMLILVPDQGQFDEIESRLDASFIEAASQGMRRTNMALSFPKYTFESSFALSDALKELGMPEVFIPYQADFSGIDGTRDLFIQEVVHKSFVDVDERGTEAAAATGVVVGLESLPADPIDVTIDRPFIFAIRDTSTGSILFLGRVLNPAP
jgi:serpin B